MLFSHFLLLACLIGDWDEMSVWCAADRIASTGEDGAVMSSLDFPTDNSYVQRLYSPDLAIK